MRQLLYVSNTRRNLAQPELEAILEQSRRNNGAAAITGMLLHIDGAFLQVLEGQADALEQTYARIRCDNRHWGAQTLLDQDAPRAFSQWSMGFQRLGPGRLDVESAFRITQDAVAARIHANAPVEIAMLLRNFQRVHDGQTFSV
jgi:hypothetical protein